MIFGKSRIELKVGIFVFIGLVILMIFVLSISNFRTMIMSHRVDFLFKFANGVKVGAPIRFSGIDIGEVKGLEFIQGTQTEPGKIRMVGWIRNDVRIPVDSGVWINTLGLLGEKYIEIMPGKDYEHFVPVKGVLIGTDPMPMQDVFGKVTKVADDIDDSITRIRNKEGTIGKLLYDDGFYNQLMILTAQLQTSLTTITQEFDGLITDIRAHPWKLFYKTKEKKK